MRHFLYTFLIVLIYVVSGYGGSGIHLVHADMTIGKLDAGQRLTIFTGNVHFRQDTLEMYCDSAVYYEKDKYADFNGRVLVIDGLRLLRADKIEYYPSEKTAFCYDNVQVVTALDSIYAESLIYNFNTKNANAAVDFYVFNAKENVKINGEKGAYVNDDRLFSVQNKTRLIQIDSTTHDTLWIYSEKLEYFATDSAKAVVSDSVTIIQNELIATADSATYHINHEAIWLRHNPIAWYGKNKLSGKVLKVELDSMKVKSIFSYEDAKAIELVDSVKKKYNKLDAKTIEFQIMNNKPERIIASGNAVSQYYLKGEEGDQGMNRASADTLLLYFTEGELDSLMIVGGSEGVYYPENYQGEKIEER